jgi:hypothetical protein
MEDKVYRGWPVAPRVASGRARLALSLPRGNLRSPLKALRPHTISDLHIQIQTTIINFIH